MKIIYKLKFKLLHYCQNFKKVIKSRIHLYSVQLFQNINTQFKTYVRLKCPSSAATDTKTSTCISFFNHTLLVNEFFASSFRYKIGFVPRREIYYASFLKTMESRYFFFLSPTSNKDGLQIKPIKQIFDFDTNDIFYYQRSFRVMK